MHHTALPRLLGLTTLLACLALPVPAQTPPTATGASTAVLPDTAATAATNPASAPAAPVVPPAPEGCRPLSDRAMAVDLKAATAQSQKGELTEQARLYDEAVLLWSQAVGQCEGRAKERAQRNLNDSLRTRASIQEQLGSGPQCAAAHKDAGAFQDMARQALGERRWGEAATLYRKSEDMWELASERCSGTPQEAALRRRDLVAIDADNAEHCAPQFEKAREQTQRLRTLAPGLSREEKQEASQVAETLWRDALPLCKGPVLDTARSNAQAIARERGTPWVMTRLAELPAPAAKTATTETGGTPAAQSPRPASNTVTRSAAKTVASPAPAAGALAGAATTTAAVGTAAASTGSNATIALVAATAATAASVAATPGQPEAQPPEFMAGTTRFSGQFARDPDTPTYSGTGRIHWANGDQYDGTLVQGQRHGKGLFVWASGQRYNGDWLRDKPTGQASVQFSNGNLYDGSVVNGQPQGQGQMRFAGGETYIGQFANGQPDGQGRFTWPNGDQYVGLWQAGQKHGQGVFTWKSGDRWEGLYDHDQPTAQGQLIRP